MNETLIRAEKLIRKGITKIDLSAETGMCAEHLRRVLVYNYEIRDLPPFKRVSPKKKIKILEKKPCGFLGCTCEIPIKDIACATHYSILVTGRIPEPDHLWTSEVYR